MTAARPAELDQVAERLRGMPAELRGRRQWLLWRYERRRGDKKPRKVPYYANGYKRHGTQGSDEDRAQLLLLEPVLAELGRGRYDGAGFAFLPGDGLIGIDLDGQVDDAGVVSARCQAIVQACASYTEWSPSGRGVHIIVAGQSATFKDNAIGVEVFCGSQFFTCTGRAWPEAPAEIRPIAEQTLARLKATVKGSKAAAPRPAAAAPGNELQAKLESALQAISADVGYDDWVQIGMALRAALGDAGLRLWDYWSGKGSKYPGSETLARKWASFDGSGVTEATVFKLAMDAGWKPPRTQRLHVLGKAADQGPPDDALPPPAAPGGVVIEADVWQQRQRRGARAAAAEPPTEIADFANPVEAAESLVRKRWTGPDDHRLVHYWQGLFHVWAGSHFSDFPVADLRAQLYSEGSRSSAKPVRKRNIDDVLDALRASANLSHRDVPAAPAWIDATADDPDPREVIPVRNGLLRIADQVLMPPTPRFFAPWCLPFDYVPDTPPPATWLQFLASVWPDDPESILTLQEWMGYLLTADTRQQKALMLVGPRRSGKGTIGRVIVRLVGERNICSPTLSSLGTNFGLQPLIGKTVALISDARLGSRADVAAVAENFLRVSGEDTISVDRKFQEPYTSKLLTRIILLANEVPTFRDAATAMPGRLIIIQTTKTFFGVEDVHLDAKLGAELAGILAWSLAGLRRLNKRGRFVQPKSGVAELRLMEDLASPIGAFLRDQTIREPGAEVPIVTLYASWREWCKAHGRDQPGTEQTFGRDVAAAAPGLQIRRPRIDGTRVRMYAGLRLRTPDDPPGQDDEDDDE